MSQTHMVSTYRPSTITPVHRSWSRPPSDTRYSLSRVNSPSSATAFAQRAQLADQGFVDVPRAARLDPFDPTGAFAWDACAVLITRWESTNASAPNENGVHYKRQASLPGYHTLLISSLPGLPGGPPCALPMSHEVNSPPSDLLSTTVYPSLPGRQ